jgi:hypothetical protein
MRYREIVLGEQRSHPEQNPHATVAQALAPYRHDPSIYVSFTHDVGQASHASVQGAAIGGASMQPVGDAAALRPARHASGSKVGINPRTQHHTTPAGIFAYPLAPMWDAIVEDRVPFGAQRPFVQVLRARGPVLNLAEYTAEALDHDIAKLKPVLSLIAKAKGLPLAKLLARWRGEVATAAGPGVQFWSIVRQAANSLSAQRLGRLGDEDFNLASALAKSPATWNGLLRRLGYSAILDGGAGVIHATEPHQVVFLSKNALEVVDTIRNVSKDPQYRLPIHLPVASRRDEPLHEADWSDRSPLIQALAKSKGRWIHFSRVPKIGVNPQTVWKTTGPFGVYLYPVEFLLNPSARTLDGQQFGTDLPYYFLCDLNLAGALHLPKMSAAEALSIAERNGFTDPLKAAFDKGEDFMGRPWSCPGAAFWDTIKRLDADKTISWNRALKGVTVVTDDEGIIYNYEPQQAVVLNPRALTNITMHKNIDAGFRNTTHERPDQKIIAWRKVYKDVLDALQARYGGTIRWKEDKDLLPYDTKRGAKVRAPALPWLRFANEGRSFSVVPVLSRMDHGFRLTFKFGREEDTRRISADEMSSLSTKEITAKIAAFIDEVMSFESDLRFTPFIGEEEVEDIINEGIGAYGSTPFTVTSEVSNHATYGTVTYNGERKATFDDIPVETGVTVRVRKDRMSAGARVRLMDQLVIDVSQYEDFTDRPTMIAALLDEVAEKLTIYRRIWGPDNSRSAFNFATEEQWAAFIGWLVVHCGLNFDGALRDRYADEIAAYDAYEEKDMLTYKIENVFRARGY